MLGDIYNIVPVRRKVRLMQRWVEWKVEHTLPEAIELVEAVFPAPEAFLSGVGAK